MPASSQLRASLSWPPSTPEAQQALSMRWREQLWHVPPAQADIIVALGGDGLMLKTLHRKMQPRYADLRNELGTVGFLMNQYRPAACRRG